MHPDNAAHADSSDTLSEPMVRIVREATRLFKEKGFAASTTRELAAALGINPATLHYHIGSKEQLLLLIHLQVNRDATARRRAIIQAHVDDDPIATMRELIKSHCHILVDQRDGIAVYSDDLPRLSTERREVVIEARREFNSLMETVVQEAVESGQISQDVSTLTYLITTTVGSIHRWYSPDGTVGVDDMAELTADFLLHGIRS